MTYRVRNIVIAVVLAALAALMTSFYVTNFKRHVQAQEKHVPVFVAKVDIPVGTPGPEVAKMLKEKEVTNAAVEPGAISNPAKELSGYVTAQRIFSGEQVSLNNFDSAKQTGVRADLKGTLRAYALPGDANQLLAGTLRAGDHVDLVANFKYKRGNSTNTFAATRIVLRDVKVLKPAPAPSSASKLGSTSSDYTVLLAVTDNQSQKLHFTAMNSAGQSSGGSAGWWLELRPPVNSADSPDSVETLGTVLQDGLKPSQVNTLYGKFGG